MVPVQSIAARLRRWHSLIFSADPGKAPPDPENFGRWGERAALHFLKLEGCRILRRNFRAEGGGEVDIVCRHGQELVFVEVKTRRNRQHGDPSEAVDRKKRQLITRGALAWLRLLGNPDLVFRFDIIEVTAAEGEAAECHWIQDAFELPGPYLY